MVMKNRLNLPITSTHHQFSSPVRIRPGAPQA